MTNGYTIVNVGYGSELIAQDCTFSYSTYGIRTRTTSTVTVSSCEFIGNSYNGIIAYGGSTINLSACTFSGNSIGLLCSGSTVTDIGSNYTNNYGTNYSYFGSAISTYYGCVYTAESVVFTNNLSNSGGALGIRGSSTITITDALFYNNTGSYDGGAFYCGDSSVVKFYDTTFSSNSATIGGAGDCYPTCSMVCENCILENNESRSGNDGSCNFGKYSTTGSIYTGSTARVTTAGAIKIN